MLKSVGEQTIIVLEEPIIFSVAEERFALLDHGNSGDFWSCGR